MNKLRIAQEMAPYQEAMIQAVVSLCAIPSVKGDPEPGSPFGVANRAALDAFLELGRSLGFTATDLDGYCGYVEWGEGQPLTAVLCHLDVVPAVDGWTHDPFDPVLTADRIIARGTADDKGPLVSALFAMKALRDEGMTPRGRVRLIAGLDEESGSQCMKHYVEVAQLPDQGFTPDSVFPVIHAEKGIVHLELTMTWPGQSAQAQSGRPVLIRAEAGQRANMVPVRCDLTWLSDDLSQSVETVSGKAAHASLPWDGENAISLAMAHAAELGSSHPFVRFYQRYVADGWAGYGLGIQGADSSGPLTVNPGVLRLDQESACLTLDIRYPATGSLDDLLDTLRKTVATEPVTIHVASHTAPLSIPADSPLVQTLMQVYNRVMDTDAQAIAVGGGTYARAMPNIVAFGPTFPGDPDVCHQVDEFVTYEKLLASAVVYREALRELAG